MFTSISAGYEVWRFLLQSTEKYKIFEKEMSLIWTVGKFGLMYTILK